MDGATWLEAPERQDNTHIRSRENSFMTSHSPLLQSPRRPSKRRRRICSSESTSPPADGTPSDISHQVNLTRDEYDLPSDGDACQSGSAEDEDRSSHSYSGRAPKNTIYASKYCKPLENTYVTQLTQPPSSPSKVRGPRWKKKQLTPMAPSSESVPLPDQAAEPSRMCKVGNDFEEDELALIAALSSSEDVEAGLEEVLPHQPLGTSFAMSGSQRKPQTSCNTASLRQSTLIGQPEGQGPPSKSQARIHNWPLTTKFEPPTHHQLNHEALGTWIYPTNLGSIRDYQYNIVQRGLFHNLLVALPTGLGKTFIAATIMLNWFRWTVDAQIVFVAPTKPLVSQQSEACFGIVGIPRSQTTMLTGNVQPAIRAEEWQSKRVFFMTPQTLIHDLKTGICDPKKLVLLVVDEAHRATGNYAYVEVVKFLRRFNSSFRVLALTATPGSSVEAVQDVIDSLDVARVEIRTEESLDISRFIHRRNINIEVFEDSEELSMSLDLFSRALQPVLDQLVSLNAYWIRNPSSLTPYGLTKAWRQWMQSKAARQGGFAVKGKANAIFKVLASLAHAIQLLKFHGIGSFYRNLQGFQGSTSDGTNNGKYAQAIAKDEHFKRLMIRLQGWVSNPDFVGHPKLSYLKTVVLNHFMDEGERHGIAGGRPPSDTRIMIFVQYRDSAEEVTRVLKHHEPMIRPHVFVGQTGAKASEGMDQKTQLDVIDKFKKGAYNTIVATSIGEEGLDIGEVDLIVCYDSSSSPIRMLQRMGRTGRKRAGNIVLLQMKGKEEESFVQAKDNYEKMQQMIANGSRFTFHEERSPRIIPKEIVPVPDKKQVDIPVENSQLEAPVPRKRGRVTKRAPKKFHMPDGVETGFVQASLVNGKSTKTRRESVLDAEVAPLPNLESVLLSTKEETELDYRYCNVGGSTPQYVQRPRFDAFPSLQRKARPTSKVGHSGPTQKLVKCLNAMQHPIDHSEADATVVDYAKTLSSPASSHEETELITGPGAGSLDSRSSSDTAASDEGLSQIGELSAETSPGARRHDRWPRPNISSGPSPGTHRARSREDHHPFYVSQPSSARENVSDDEFPDVVHLVSGRTKQNPSTRTAAQISPAKETQSHRRWKRQRVLDDDSDDE